MAPRPKTFFDQTIARFVAWCSHQARLFRDPESVVGLFIVTVWCVAAGLQQGLVVTSVVLLIGWFLHLATVESGSHVLLWLTTSMLLILIVLASETTLGGLRPVLLAAAGATALLHNELVRINYTRRRNATVHRSIYHSSAVALTVVTVVSVVGVALTEIFATGVQRTWLWMPAAAGMLLLVGLALAIGPARNASEASRERWMPGGRIPPQPVKNENEL